MQFDIFLSYRRDGGYETAKHLYDLLTRDGFSVSFDIDTLKSGDFDRQLLERIDNCKDFLLIIDRHCFDRTINGTCPPEQDWLRCELAHALQKNKNIVPVFLAGVYAFPENLPDDLKGVIVKNGPKYDRDYFDAFYRKLRENFLLSKPNILDSNKFTLKKVITILFSILGALLLVSAIVLSVIRHNRNVRDFDFFISLGNELVVKEQKRIEEDGDKPINSKNISEAHSYYVKALEIKIRDTERIYGAQSKAATLSQVLDSCQIYEENLQLIQKYLLEQRMATAESLKLRQNELTENIVSMIHTL